MGINQAAGGWLVPRLVLPPGYLGSGLGSTWAIPPQPNRSPDMNDGESLVTTKFPMIVGYCFPIISHY